MKKKYDFWEDLLKIFREEAHVLEQKNDIEEKQMLSPMNEFELLLKDFDPSF